MSVEEIMLQPSRPGRHRDHYGTEALTADLRVRKGRAPESNGKHRASNGLDEVQEALSHLDGVRALRQEA